MSGTSLRAALTRRPYADPMWRRVVAKRLHSRRSRLIAAATVLVLVVAGLLVGIAASGDNIRLSSRFVTGTPEGSTKVELDTTLYVPQTHAGAGGAAEPGLRRRQDGSLDSTARTLAEHGYVVLAYTARGFGSSGGLIHFASPNYEVHDGALLIDYLAGLNEVARKDGKPQIAMAGSSYGGGAVAAHRRRRPAGQGGRRRHHLERPFARAVPELGATTPGCSRSCGPGCCSATRSARRRASARCSATGPPTAKRRIASAAATSPPTCVPAYQASAATGAPNAAMRALMRRPARRRCSTASTRRPC